MTAGEMDQQQPDGSGIAPGTTAPARALRSYMEWWSESVYAAGWLIGLAETMLSHGDEPFLWLVAQAGGWWDDDEAFVCGAVAPGGHLVRPG